MISTTTDKSSTIRIYPYAPIEVDFGSLLKTMSDAEFFDFCQRHEELRIERESDGEIIIMPPTFSETGRKNFNLLAEFAVWSKRNGTGIGFDSSTGFTLSNGAVRSPDLSWIKLERWNNLSDEERERFARISPDFVVELRSQSDSLSTLQDKMEEYIENGVSLGWLIDAAERKIYVYRPDKEVEVLENPTEISGEPLLEGFTLNLREIWE
jgi:Uma2 family endonuclease